MPDINRDAANYALHFETKYSKNPEGLPYSSFFMFFMFLCDKATEEELEKLSLAFPDYVAAHRLLQSAEGIDILRALAHPTAT